MKRLLLVVCLALTTSLVPSLSKDARADCPAQDTWPDPHWTSMADTVKTEKAAQIAALEKFAFTLTGKDEDRLGVRTDAVVIVKHGQIVYEKYARGFTAANRHEAWSVSKSVANALTGVAVQNIGFDLDKSICDFVKPGRESSCKITSRNLMEFSSGLDWRESYEHASYQVSSVLAMLYGMGHDDMGAFVSGHQLRAEPGTTYMYSTGDPTLLMSVVQAAMKKARQSDDWPWTLLFDKIGAPGVTFERDDAGTLAGGSYWYARPRDFARFGYLFLNDGCWKGERLLPENWVWWSTDVSLPIRLSRLDASPGDVQGRYFWLNVPLPEQHDKAPWPDAPADTYAAIGHWGQYIFVVPSEDTIIVRTGDDRNDSIDENQLIKLSLAVAR